jgi:transcriptional regulator with XRE-family HTH domain
MIDTDYDKRLGQRLKALREIHRMTQADVGARIGFSHQQIQKYESGQSHVRANLIQQFATLFQVSAAQLIEDSDILADQNRPYASLPAKPMGVAEASDTSDMAYIDHDIVKLVTLFSQIHSPQQRAIVLDLAASLQKK